MKDWIRVALGVAMSLGIVALLVLAFLPRQAPSTAASEPAAEPTSAAPTPSSAPTETAPPAETAAPTPAITDITVIGDGWTSGSSANSGPDALWPALIAQQFEIDARPAGVPGSGYVASSSGGSTFADLVDDSDPTTGAIVVFGSSNDSGAGYDEIYAAATELYAALAQRSPDTPVLIIGPAYLEAADALSDAEIANRDAVRDAAVAAGLTFVDPVAEDWFAAEDSALIAANGVNPNDPGQRYLAERIAPSIQALLGQ